MADVDQGTLVGGRIVAVIDGHVYVRVAADQAWYGSIVVLHPDGDVEVLHGMDENDTDWLGQVYIWHRESVGPVGWTQVGGA